MLDIKKIRENPEYYIAETEKKYTTVSLRDVLAVDNERRPLLTEVERLKSERNAQSKRIGELKKKGENADEAQAATRELGNKIDELDKKLKDLRRWLLPLDETVRGMKIDRDDATGALTYTIIDVEQRKFDNSYQCYGPIPKGEVLKWSNLKQNKGW